MASRGGNATFSVIGPDVSIKGDISASADLHVDGNVEGDIACSSIVQGETSRISGGIEAENARLAGQVSGTVKARELVILRAARIEGDVQYDSLTIEQGAMVEGRFAHSVPARGAAAPTARSGEKPAATPASAKQPSDKGEEPKLTIAH